MVQSIANELSSHFDSDSTELNTIIPDTLFRLTQGLPCHELQIMLQESIDCEAALTREIRILEESLGLPSSFPLPESENTPTATASDNTANKNKNATRKESEEDISIILSPLLPKPYNPNLNWNINWLSSSDEILDTVFAPHDRYFTLSALLGRLREPLTLPPIPHTGEAVLSSDPQENRTSVPSSQTQSQQKKSSNKRLSMSASELEVLQYSSATKSHNNSNTGTTATVDMTYSTSTMPSANLIRTLHGQSKNETVLLKKQKALLALHRKEIYTKQFSIDQNQPLLSLWKRISSHRTALVFRKAVNPDEAPGYTQKIKFPMDLGLIRKMILGGYISSFQQLHEYIGLICHNCVKFNGRESDYAVLAREFEAYVDDSFLDVIQKLEVATATTSSSSSSTAESVTVVT